MGCGLWGRTESDTTGQLTHRPRSTCLAALLNTKKTNLLNHKKDVNCEEETSQILLTPRAWGVGEDSPPQGRGRVPKSHFWSDSS